MLRDRKRSEDQINADAKLTTIAGDIDTYISLAPEETNAEQRNDLLKDLDRELTNAETFVSEQETRTLLSGETDHLNAIMTIKPGAGGTESQDWASILLRMYLRWAERKGMNAVVLDETAGDEAGIKNATVQFSGENAYGLLTGETGVHRLVRISPFDQAARRHTSFASVFVIPEIDDRIEINIKPGRSARRYVSRGRQGRAERQQGGDRGAHHAHCRRTRLSRARWSEARARIATWR